MSSTGPPPHALFHVNNEVGRAFAWISIGLAVLTAFFQGMVSAIAFMTEASTRWTFRFRLALLEHWWWSFVCVLLLASLVMNALSFASGNGGDAISVLILSSATFLAIVQYMLPAWQDRHYTHTRWLAWTGDSRTSIDRGKAALCGDYKTWIRLTTANQRALSDLQQTHSDIYGWRLWRVDGIKYDPTDILNVAGEDSAALLDQEGGISPSGIYHNGDPTSTRASLRWGRQQNFRRRVSRAISSMPLGLLNSSPITVDGYDGKGLCKAMGILGRNKGLQLGCLKFAMNGTISRHMEDHSTWAPRPSKVLRSFYRHTLHVQYHTISEDFVLASVELALILADIPYWAMDKWLVQGLEQQSLAMNEQLANVTLRYGDEDERNSALTTHYESSYVSMIISLNHMDRRNKHKHDHSALVGRPDMLCTGLRLKALGHSEPSWWNAPEIAALRQQEVSCLSTDGGWKSPVAGLLGLPQWPEDFDAQDSKWDPVLESNASASDTDKYDVKKEKICVDHSLNPTAHSFGESLG